MSYCRWSSMDHTCDLYAYDDVHGGITTHIATRRVDWGEDGPPPSPLSKEGYDLLTAGKTAEWAEMNRAYTEALQTRPRVEIGLPHDGESYNDADAEAFLARLLHLREVGYRFPDHVIEAAREDAAEEAEET